jgi:hypothetical protein
MKEEKIKEFEELFNRAREAGLAAGKGHTPTPMVVGQAADLFSNKIIPGTEEVVHDGVCGFAWIVVRPGNCSFAKWLKASERASPHYYGGVSIWVSDFNQSMERKERYATAFADVLNAAGIKASAGSRMD